MVEFRIGTGRGYVPGNPYFRCMRCDESWRHSEKRIEWTGLVVCPDCWDPRPPQMDPPVIYPEGLPLPNPSPDVEDSGPNTTTPGDL